MAPNFGLNERYVPVKPDEEDLTASDPHCTYDIASSTRTCCILGLALCWACGLAIASFGIVVYHPGRYSDALSNWHLTDTTIEIIPLAINVLVTLLVESSGFIHTASLRWALLRDNKLEFNSNLRLFTSSRASKPNRWYANALMLICIAFAYTSSSLTLEEGKSQRNTTTPRLQGALALPDPHTRH